MKNLFKTMAVALAAFSAVSFSQAAPQNTVHGISDLGHEFSFYADGRFQQQYLPGQKVVTSWGNLYDIDPSNANLLILLSCDPQVEYNAKDLKFINAFMEKGGAVLVMGNHGNTPQNKLAAALGAKFDRPASPPLKATKDLKDAKEIEGGPGSTLDLKGGGWTPLITDSANKPVMAIKNVGKGKLIVAARSLAGNRPDAKDNINAEWWTPLLEQSVSGKKVSPNKPFQGTSLTNLGNKEVIDDITYHYSDYLEPYFKAMVAIEKRCRPAIEKRMGVPLSSGMASSVGLLATGGGGFSSGSNTGLAVFWEDFPKREDGMIEFITHETVHSWVLPHPEVWNEPIATYVGNLVMQDLGHKEEGQKRIKNNINRAMRIDDTMTKYDINGNATAPGARELNDGEKNEIHWGKTFWVFEEMRKLDPEFLAKYFQAKRKFVPNKLDKRYSDDMNLTVAVISKALNKNMFPWFNEHGMKVDPSAVTIPDLQVK